MKNPYIYLESEIDDSDDIGYIKSYGTVISFPEGYVFYPKSPNLSNNTKYTNIPRYRVGDTPISIAISSNQKYRIIDSRLIHTSSGNRMVYQCVNDSSGVKLEFSFAETVQGYSAMETPSFFNPLPYVYVRDN